MKKNAKHTLADLRQRQSLPLGVVKVKIICAPGVSKAHGIRVGRVFEMTHPPGRPEGVWVMGDLGELVRLWAHEFDIVEEES